MPAQAKFVARNGGIRTCPACGRNKKCVFLGVLHEEQDWSKSISVCLDCITKQGVSFMVDIPFKDPLVGKARRKIAKRVKRGERETGKEIGGVVTLASGAINNDGDAKNSNWMVEEKSTTNKSFSIKEAVISKALDQAAGQSKSFVMKVRLASFTIGVLLWNDVLPMIREEQ